MDFTVTNPQDFLSGSQIALASYGSQKFLDVNRAPACNRALCLGGAGNVRQKQCNNCECAGCPAPLFVRNCGGNFPLGGNCASAFLPTGGGGCSGNSSQMVACNSGGWSLYLSDGKFSLWTNMKAHTSEPLQYNLNGSTRIQALIAADEMKSEISFNVTNTTAEGCYSSTSSCSCAVSGNMNFDGFDRRSPNFFLNVGGRGWSFNDLVDDPDSTNEFKVANPDSWNASQLWRNQSYNFDGDVDEAIQLMHVSAE